MTGAHPSRSGVLCGGSFIADILKRIDRYPPEDEVALIGSEEPACGGPAFNMAADLRLLGAAFPIGAIGRVGADANGRLIQDTLARLSIDQRQIIVTEDAPTAYVDVMTVQATGRRTFFYREGAAGRLAPEDFDFTGQTHRIFHCGAPGLHGGMDQIRPNGNTGFAVVLRRARAAGFATNMELVSLPANKLLPLVAPCLPHLDSLIINDHEAGALAGVDLRPGGQLDWAAAEEACRRIAGQGPLGLVSVHFPEGGVARDAAGRMHRQGSVRMADTEIVSAVGAGDAFAAGLLLAMHEGWGAPRGLELAVASAAQSLRGETTTSAMKPWPDCIAAAAAAGHRPSGAAPG